MGKKKKNKKEKRGCKPLKGKHDPEAIMFWNQGFENIQCRGCGMRYKEALGKWKS